MTDRSAEAIAAAAGALLNKPEKLKNMAEAGYSYWSRSLSPATTAIELEALYAELAATRQPTFASSP